jgi:hypothetical protein
MYNRSKLFLRNLLDKAWLPKGFVGWEQLERVQQFDQGVLKQSMTTHLKSLSAMY